MPINYAADGHSILSIVGPPYHGMQFQTVVPDRLWETEGIYRTVSSKGRAVSDRVAST